MTINFTPRRTGQYAVDVLQDVVRAAFDKIDLKKIIFGQLIEDVTLSTTARDVHHGLGHAPVGYLVIRRSAGETVYDQQDANADQRATLRLLATGDVTVDLWIF